MAQSGRPIILFNLLPLVNSDFETEGTDVPGWDIATLSLNDLQSDEAGEGFRINPRAGTRGLKQNVSANAVLNKSVCAQRLDMADLANVISFYGGFLACAVMVRYVDGKADTNANMFLKQFSGGTITVDSGTEKVPTEEYKETYRLGSDWGLMVHKIKVDPAAVWAEVRLEYEIFDTGDYDAASNVFWDNVYIGGMVDFVNKGLKGISLKPDLGFRNNIGDGVSEIVRVSTPSGKLDLAVNQVVVDTDLDRDIQCFLESMAIDVPHGCVIWTSRLRHTSRGRHYADAMLDPKSPQYKYPPGVHMRNYKFKFLLPNEY